MSIVRLARPEIQTLVAYDAAAQVDETLRLNANESPQTNPVDKFRRPLNRYPEVRPAKLQSALAKRFGCRNEQLLVTRGSSEAIDLVIRAFCRAGVDNVLTPAPSFEMYRHYSIVQGVENVQVATRAEQNFEIDVDELIAACNEETRVIFLCSPNNPTGTPLPRADILKLLDARSDRSVIVVDEAYIEFGRQKSTIDLLDRYPNLLVLRTLSKALGFAGARCGAVAGNADVIRLLNAIQAPYALATPVVECVEDAMEASQLARAENAVAEVISERERLAGALREYPFVEKIWPSEANFILIKCDNADSLISHCAEHNVLLRNFGGVLPNCIRISIGSPQDNARLLSVLDVFPERTS